MSLAQTSHGKVLVAPSCEFVYLSPAEMELRKRRREFGKKARRALAVGVALSVAVAVVWGCNYLQDRSARRTQDFQAAQSTAEPAFKAFQTAVGIGYPARFAPDAMGRWKSSRDALQYRLTALKADPEDPSLLRAFRGQVQQTGNACLASQDALKGALIQKSKDRCPRHPSAVRESSRPECPYPPARHYLFDVWTSRGRYYWRNGRKTVSIRLSQVHLCN